jgi:phospholipid/cholesterol/gamma-HCH transport system substrate-binding protein
LRTAIRKHLGDFIAIIALFLVAVGVAGYILHNQRLRFPLIEEAAFTLKVELPNAQAVTPGQGQTVRVAGVEVGQIGEVSLEEGKAVVDLQIEPRYKDLIRRDATALLRPKTGVKDMFLEIDPGDAEPLPANGRIQVENTLEDIDPDEVLSALDSDTRDYLRLLIAGAGKGLDGRGEDLREALKRLGPLHRDLAKVSKAIADRRANMRRLVHNYGLLTTELGRSDRQITRLVRTSSEVFDALASEDDNISTAVARLPGALRQTDSTLSKVDTMAQRLRPSLESLRPAFRKLDEANEQVKPLAEEGTPVLKNEVRPFARAARPFTQELGTAGGQLAKAAPDLTKTFKGLNRLFNIGAYNQHGAEGLSGNLAQDRARDEGYLYWLGWTAQNTVSMFSTSDANGPFRRIYLGGLNCSSVTSVLPAADPLAGPIADALGDAGVCLPRDSGEGVTIPGVSPP